MRKFYVFDQFDCFGEYSTMEDASKEAARLIANELERVHIIHLTQTEFDAYCETGCLPD